MVISTQLPVGVLRFYHLCIVAGLGFSGALSAPNKGQDPRPSTPIHPPSHGRLVGAPGEQRSWPASAIETFTRTTEHPPEPLRFLSLQES